MNDEKTIKCKVTDGKFVEPCDTLSQVANLNLCNPKQKGIIFNQLTNLKTHNPSRSFFMIRCNEFPKGMCLNFCPFCGVQIDAPFAEKEGEKK